MAQIVYRSNVVFADGRKQMPQWAEDSLKTYLDFAQVDAVQVSSGYRSPEDQARIMSENVASHGMPSQRKLYGQNGNRVLDAYPDRAAMAAVVRSIGQEKISRHMALDAVVFDIAPSSITGGVAGAAYRRLIDVLDNVASDANWRNDPDNTYEIGELLYPPDDPALHIEFPNRSANVAVDDTAGGKTLGMGDLVVGVIVLGLAYKAAQVILAGRR